MAIDLLIKQGNQAEDTKDFVTAISKYTDALKENPEAFTPLVKRAQVYTKLKNYESAKADITKAFTVADKRGKMSDKAICHFRLGLVNYAEKDFQASLVNFKKAKELNCPGNTLDIWIAKVERDIKKISSIIPAESTQKETHPEKDENTQSVSKRDNTSSSLDTINKQAPLKAKIRDEWYQSKDYVTITIFAKDIAKESVQVKFGTRSLSVTFPTSDSSEYNYDLDGLYGEILPEKSSYMVGTKKIEITLHKSVEGRWAALEGEGPIAAPVTNSAPSGLAYPSSSRKRVDWSNVKVDDDEEDSGDFFSKLYKGVDEDTRRAMMKSYVESNGTILTTDWTEAKERTFKTTPPEGMQAKKWVQ
ncbi:hypothetical protein JCM33374_g250 [Metschnikowia sp. JCM 33374]|nr:hypothetical protein JCM33374_g250 [Metschnikowia sp. JCM 33374]